MQGKINGWNWRLLKGDVINVLANDGSAGFTFALMYQKKGLPYPSRYTQEMYQNARYEIEQFIKAYDESDGRITPDVKQL